MAGASKTSPAVEEGDLQMRHDIVPGAFFPDYELPDHTAKRRKLSELQGEDPLVLVLSRGGFCPKERRQHEGLVALHRELEVGYSAFPRGWYFPASVRKAMARRFQPLMAMTAIVSLTNSSSLNSARAASYSSSDA